MGTTNNTCKRKRKRSDSVLWQKNLHPPKNSKSNLTTQKHATKNFELQIILVREKGRDLTPSYDKRTYTHRKIRKATWQHKNTPPKTSITQWLRTVFVSLFSVSDLVRNGCITGWNSKNLMLDIWLKFGELRWSHFFLEFLRIKMNASFWQSVSQYFRGSCFIFPDTWFRPLFGGLPVLWSLRPVSQTLHRLNYLPELNFTELRGFHRAFATNVACQQGALTLPDTWFRPPPPILGLACSLIVETRFLEFSMSFLDFSPRIPLGTFSILLCKQFC